MGLLGVDPGGLGVKCEQLGLAQLVQPDLQARSIENGLVARFGFGGGRLLRRDRLPRALGFALQFVNVKIYLFGITALTGFITDYSRAFPVLFLFEMIIATVGTIATATWIGLGMMIQTFYEKHFRIINIIMALTLLECIYSILVS